MENKLNPVTAVSAVVVAAYAAIAMRWVAQYGLGFSLEQIRGTALFTAVVIAAFIAIEFFGKRLRRAK